MLKDITDYIGLPTPKRVKIQHITFKRNRKVIDMWDVEDFETTTP